jgi:hypothetical protein
VTLNDVITGVATLAIAAMFPIVSVSQTATDQPHMAAALEHLKQAEREIDMAEFNKGGHRSKAVEYIKKAEAEVDAGIAYARANPNAKQNYHGVLAPEWQKNYDSYYQRWLKYRATNNTSEMASMEARMRDIMKNYNIPPNVPFDQVASPGIGGNR